MDMKTSNIRKSFLENYKYIKPDSNMFSSLLDVANKASVLIAENRCMNKTWYQQAVSIIQILEPSLSEEVVRNIALLIMPDKIKK